MITLDDLQGFYEIAYQSDIQLPGWYESGVASAQISDNKLTGLDGAGISWNATIAIQTDGSIAFNAVLDPSNAPAGSGLMGKNGQMTRQPQTYEGILKVTKAAGILLLRTTVIQGPLTINVQFKKVK